MGFACSRRNTVEMMTTDQVGRPDTTGQVRFRFCDTSRTTTTYTSNCEGPTLGSVTGPHRSEFHPEVTGFSSRCRNWHRMTATPLWFAQYEKIAAEAIEK